MTKRSTAPARALAVLALIGGFIVLVVVVSAALSGGDSNNGRQGGSRGNVSRQTTPDKKAPKVYVIENEDTLTAIAHKTGVPVATIERLNPQVDPLSLIAGEELKLR
jgi:LysM repeat protein